MVLPHSADDESSAVTGLWKKHETPFDSGRRQQRKTLVCPLSVDVRQGRTVKIGPYYRYDFSRAQPSLFRAPRSPFGSYAGSSGRYNLLIWAVRARSLFSHLKVSIEQINGAWPGRSIFALDASGFSSIVTCLSWSVMDRLVFEAKEERLENHHSRALILSIRIFWRFFRGFFDQVFGNQCALTNLPIGGAPQLAQ